MADNRLNRWRNEVEELAEVAIRDTDSALQREYKNMLRQIKKDANEALKHPENLTRTDAMRQDRRLAIARQIQDDLRDSHPGIRETIKKGVERNAELGYYGNWYELEQNNNLEINMNMLDKRKLEQVVTKPVNGKRFSKRLYDNREKLASQVNRALINGIENGLGYREVANQLESAVDGNYKRALRIARTESLRANSEARQESNIEAMEAGVQFQKKWLSTLDGDTRDTHQSLDGQTVSPDEEFISDSGAKALEPRMFGVAEEDIQCRCTSINIVAGIEPDTRMARNRDGDVETVEYKSYNEWREGLEERQPVEDVEQVTSRISELQETMNRMEDGDYGGLSEEEAEALYDQYDEELEKLLEQQKELLSNNDYQVVPEQEIDSFFNTKEGYQKWNNSLADYDKEVIEGYTENDYRVFNAIKRDGEQEFIHNSIYKGSPMEWKEKMVKKSDELTEVIGRYTTEEAFVSYRKFDRYNGYVDLSKDDIGKIKILDEGFMSTSLKQSTTDTFGSDISYEIRIDKGLNVGAYVGENSGYGQEKEFLLKPSTKFRVIDVENKMNNGRNLQNIVVEVVEDE